MLRYVEPSEAIKRLAAAQGIDVLNLIKTNEQLMADKQQLAQEKAQQSLVDQTGQLAGTPLMDPTKNPDIAEQATNAIQGISQQPPQ